MTDSTPPALACTRSAAPDRPPGEGGRATSPPPLRRAAPGIHGPRTCEHGGRGTNHLRRGSIRYPEPKTGPRAAVHSRDRRTKASALLTSLALVGLSLHPDRAQLGKSIVPTNGTPRVEVIPALLAVCTAASQA